MSPELDIGRHLNHRPAVGLEVYKTTQANIVDVVARALKVVESARDCRRCRASSSHLFGNQAARHHRVTEGTAHRRDSSARVLAFIVLFQFLRDWPTTLIVTLAVPFSLVITLAAMYFLGLSINILSMMGMMLAIGMLVDNAVVITESIFRHRQIPPGSARRRRRSPACATSASQSPRALRARWPSSCRCCSASAPKHDLPGARRDTDRGRDDRLAPGRADAVPMLTARFPAPPPIAAGTLPGRLQRALCAHARLDLEHKWWTAVGIVLVLASVALPADAGEERHVPARTSGRNLFMAYHIDGTFPLQRVESAVNLIEGYLEKNRERFEIETLYSLLPARRGRLPS